jgi:hypothetical protein
MNNAHRAIAALGAALMLTVPAVAGATGALGHRPLGR